MFVNPCFRSSFDLGETSKRRDVLAFLVLGFIYLTLEVDFFWDWLFWEICSLMASDFFILFIILKKKLNSFKYCILIIFFHWSLSIQMLIEISFNELINIFEFAKKLFFVFSGDCFILSVFVERIEERKKSMHHSKSIN